jgi:hypothetical protein
LDHYSQIVSACARVKELVEEHVEIELENERHFFGVQTEICRLFRDASNIIGDRIDGFYNRVQVQSCAWTQTETVIGGNTFPPAASTGSISHCKLQKVEKTRITEDPRETAMSPVHPEELLLLESPVPCAVKQCEYIDVYHMTFCIVVIMDTICL